MASFWNKTIVSLRRILQLNYSRKSEIGSVFMPHCTPYVKNVGYLFGCSLSMLFYYSNYELGHIIQMTNSL